jgi:tetratricopeptide (TPR) repeat protein
MKQFFFPAILSLLVLAGCQSLQKDLLYTSSADQASLAALADIIVPLDKEAPRSAVGAARTRLTELEKTNVKDRDFEGRVAAWSGRLFLLEGKPKDAAAQLKKAETFNPGSIEGWVLAIRIEGDPEKRKVLCENALAEARGGFSGPSEELNIELGRTLMDMKMYREAAAAFDSAFPHLRPVYRNTYGEIRNTAWQLRNLEAGTAPKTAEISQKSSITWDDAIELSKTETDLLRFISGGRNLSSAELFALLTERSIIPQGQDLAANSFATGTNSGRSDTLLRSGAAWYLWRLWAENRADTSLLTRYSSRYRNQGRPVQSPIPDLSVNSVFFDAVLGCIEREFMSLWDGKNFQGNKTVGGAEFLLMLKKVGGH